MTEQPSPEDSLQASLTCVAQQPSPHTLPVVVGRRFRGAMQVGGGQVGVVQQVHAHLQLLDGFQVCCCRAAQLRLLLLLRLLCRSWCSSLSISRFAAQHPFCDAWLPMDKFMDQLLARTSLGPGC